ncbi:hypothetical protein FF098_015910 [Parvularcula flava]|uniref:Uncharacterized protein n=1 Tax=Aquisalinus luteolus TaxID=1566827 RepID=A0A8J3A4D7_9PROT|nr:hypothetical protein [Aquisalinus luteolus]NHK29401.1 hypothetical protein [Aquisalinus luteolus]GGI02061.1 hypothetical protein GCM10011355_34180 [Aquisalinus luteolus]
MKCTIPDNTVVQAGRYHDLMSREFLFWVAYRLALDCVTRTGGMAAFSFTVYHPHVTLLNEWGNPLSIADDWVERAFDWDGSWLTHIKRFVFDPPKVPPYRKLYDRLLIIDLHYKIIGSPIERRPIPEPFRR